ncbi:MAG: M20/M25/M40 family metallo-hydrolase [Acidobacteria bacterium]|nr:MAG: M20/M25/M40 family metallo-hydrolase [Acidobacteriota bacterium]
MRRFALVVVSCLAISLYPGPSPRAAALEPDQRQELTQWVATHGDDILEELTAFLRLPNVSADRENIAANARALQAMWERRGAQVRLLPGDGGPYVFVHLPAQGPATAAPPLTVLFYAHYDGQPVDPARWRVTPPFQPKLVGAPDDPESRIYARSASDDKSPIIAMAAAVDALAALGLTRNVDAKFIFDPEEEVGSPHLEATLAGHAGLLAADLLIFADGPVYPTGAPTVVFGTRGIITVEITVYGPAEPVHSGHYGNWAPNPAEKLARLLSSMKDAQGHVLVDGFYDQVRPLSAGEKRALARVPPVEDELRRRLLIARPDGGGRSLQELINLPSLNVRGLNSGWVGAEARTIVPATATAAIDLRLVRDIVPEDQVDLIRAHARRLGFFVVMDEPDAATRRRHPLVARITQGAGTRAARTPMDTPLSQAIIKAVRRGSGVEPVLLPTLGGTGPLSRFEDLLGLPTYGVPMVNSDNNQHAPDENLRLGNLWDGILLYASLLRFPAVTPAP